MLDKGRVDKGQGDGRIVLMMCFVKIVSLGIVECAMSNIEEQLLHVEKEHKLPENSPPVRSIFSFHEDVVLQGRVNVEDDYHSQYVDSGDSDCFQKPCWPFLFVLFPRPG